MSSSTSADSQPLPAGLLRNLPRRAHLLRSLRATLDRLGFTEVETPVRIPAPANEPHIEPPPSGDAFLRASPELQMKRLVEAGCERIYQIGPCFREGERGERHTPEFTMLEWYRAPGTDAAVLSDCEALVREAARALHGSDRLPYRGGTLDLSPPWERWTVRAAFQEFAGWDPVAFFEAERFEHDLALRIEPALPRDRPCVLEGYPAPAASLARLRPDDPRVAERWELYLGGIEVCNAYGELTDPCEQRARFLAAAAQRRALGVPAFALDEDFLAALERGMPPTGGAALGVDRLAMVLLDAQDIDAVRAFCPPIGELGRVIG